MIVVKNPKRKWWLSQQLHKAIYHENTIMQECRVQYWFHKILNYLSLQFFPKWKWNFCCYYWLEWEFLALNYGGQVCDFHVCLIQMVRENAYFWLATRVLEHRKKKLCSKLLQWHNTNTRIKITLTLSKFLKCSDSVSLPGKLGIIKSASKDCCIKWSTVLTVGSHDAFWRSITTVAWKDVEFISW